jgi:hypothetical protein
MLDEDADLRALLETLDPKARDDLRRLPEAVRVAADVRGEGPFLTERPPND